MTNSRIKDIESGKSPLVSMHRNGRLLPSARRVINKRLTSAREALNPELSKIADSRRIPSKLMETIFR